MYRVRSFGVVAAVEGIDETLLADLFPKGEKKLRPLGPSRRRGLIGGTGGACIPFIPLFIDAPAGRSTVSMDEVPVTNVGVEISDFSGALKSLLGNMSQ